MKCRKCGCYYDPILQKWGYLRDDEFVPYYYEDFESICGEGLMGNGDYHDPEPESEPDSQAS